MYLSNFIIFVSFISSAMSLGQTATSNACSIIDDSQEGRPVIFFGGYLSQDPDTLQWVNGAKGTAKKNCPGNFKFEGHGLNGAHSSKPLVLKNKANAANIQSCVQKIHSYHGKLITLIGHSDGSWVASAIVNALSSEDRKKISLILLDGNMQSDWGVQGPPASIKCLTPSNGSKVSACDEIHWPLHQQNDPPYTTNMMSGVCSDHCQPVSFDPSPCKQNLWRAHFSLVNSNVSCELDTTNFNDQAYHTSMNVPLDYLACGNSGKGVSPADASGVE